MVIDTNVYWLPNELFTNKKLTDKFLRTVPKAYDVSAHAKRDENGQLAISIEKPLGSENLNYFENDYHLDKQLKDMDEAKVDQAVLKLPGTQEWLDLDLCRAFNTTVAKRVEESQGRMVALAVVPPYGDKESLDELDRCINELHFHGVQISAHYGNHYLDDPMFRKFFEHVNDLNIPVYVHHTPVPVDYQSLCDYNNLRRSFGRCADQIIAISRELFSGMFKDLPNLKMIHSMLGGGYFTFTNMFFPTDSGHGRFQTDNGMIKSYLKNNIYFEMSHAQPWGKQQLELAVNVLGADHVIYGSSYPVKKVWLTDGPDFVRQLNISDQDKKLILSENAKRLYRMN